MPKFSQRSLANLSTADKKLWDLFSEVIKYYDCTILCGTRSKEDQEKAFKQGRTTLHYPQSNHNSLPSRAVDVVPYPIDWSNLEQFYHFGGYVLGIAKMMGLNIRWGGDWNGDFNLKNQNFYDLPHYEVRG